MKLAIIGDIHYSDKPPSFRRSDYNENVLAKLRYIYDLDVEAVIIAGDIFHLKNPKQTSFYGFNQISNIIQKKPTYFILGNHDKYNQQTDVTEQPIHTLSLLPNVHRLTHEPVEIIPNVFVSGSDYEDDYLPTEKIQGLHLHITHMDFCGEANWPGCVHADEINTSAFVLNGHIHTPSKTYRTLGGGMITNIGSLSRVSCADRHMPCYYEIDTDEVTAVRKNIPCAQEITYPNAEYTVSEESEREHLEHIARLAAQFEVTQVSFEDFVAGLPVEQRDFIEGYYEYTK